MKLFVNVGDAHEWMDLLPDSGRLDGYLQVPGDVGGPRVGSR